MERIRYTKSELASILRLVVIAEREERIAWEQRECFIFAIASALDGNFCTLWCLLPPVEIELGMASNGRPPKHLRG